MLLVGSLELSILNYGFRFLLLFSCVQGCSWPPARPTQPPTPSGWEMSTGHSALMLGGWGVKVGWLIPYVDKRVDGR